MSPSDGCFLFSISRARPPYCCRTSAFPSMSRFCSLSFLHLHLHLHRLFPFRLPSNLSARLSPAGRPAVLVKGGHKEGIFAEFVGSELVQELGVWSLVIA